MLTGLIDGLRHLRIPLVLGYASLWSVWIGFGDELAGDEPADDSLRLLVDGVERLGPAGTAAFWSLVAVMVGGLLDRFAMQPYLGAMIRRAAWPDWTGYIDDVYEEAVAYEEQRNIYPGAKSEVPVSPARSARLRERIEARRREQADAEFRLAAVFSTFIVGLPFVARQSSATPLVLVVAIALIIDTMYFVVRTNRALGLIRFRQAGTRMNWLPSALQSVKRPGSTEFEEMAKLYETMHENYINRGPFKVDERVMDRFREFERAAGLGPARSPRYRRRRRLAARRDLTLLDVLLLIGARTWGLLSSVMAEFVDGVAKGALRVFLRGR